jgi:hypothetical protein
VLAEFYNRREATLLDLEALSRRLIEDNEAYRRTLDQQAEEHRKRVQAEFDERDRQREQQFEARHNEIEQRAKQLDALKQELDDQESRHARRQIYKDLKETLKQRNAKFTLSAETDEKRKPVNYVFWSMMTVTFGFAVANFISLLKATGIDWAATIRFAVSTVGLFGTAIYYIRWLDRWSQQHADEEFRLKRIDVDVDRSSWLAEMVLEWKQSGGSNFPKELLERLSNGLFDGAERKAEVRHPAEDALQLLLRPASGLRLGIPGLGEISYDRSGLKRLEERGQAAKAGE